MLSLHRKTPIKSIFGIALMSAALGLTACSAPLDPDVKARQEVIEQGIDKLPHDELVMCALTVKRQAFTKASRTPLGLLKEWNKHVKNQSFECIKDNINTFFKVNDELEIDYPPHKFCERLVASAYLPLWDNQDS